MKAFLRVFLVGLVAAGCGGHICAAALLDDIPIEVGAGTTPVVTWTGGNVYSLTVTESACANGNHAATEPVCWSEFGLQRLPTAVDLANPLASPYTLGDVPPGFQFFDKRSNDWGTMDGLCRSDVTSPPNAGAGPCVSGTLCAQGCVDTGKDPKNCGSCQFGVTSDAPANPAAACPDDHFCLEGKCVPASDCRTGGCPDGYYCRAPFKLTPGRSYRLTVGRSSEGLETVPGAGGIDFVATE